MAINLRSVQGELHQLLKIRAAKESVTIEYLCVRFLWWGLEAMDEPVQAEALRVREGGVPIGGRGEVGNSVDASGSGVPLITAVPMPGEGVVAHRSQPSRLRGVHDAKTCRVYKCGQCAKLKESK